MKDNVKTAIRTKPRVKVKIKRQLKTILVLSRKPEVESFEIRLTQIEIHR